jgi:hypothetical protein
MFVALTMKRAFLLALGLAPMLALAEPAARIDVSKLPAQSQMIDQVVVPVPSEIFGVLDKLGKPHWEDVLRPVKNARPTGEQPQVALLLGTVIAEGFVAVEAENVEEVKTIGRAVLTLSEAIGVRKAVLKRSKSITDFAEKKDWQAVRRELDGALADVKEAMMELKSEQMSQLVSLGGWLRGTEALTAVVAKSFTKDGAELLHQPVLLDYFDRQLAAMRPKIKANPVVSKVQKGLIEIRPLVGLADGTEISEKSVKEIEAIARELVRAIHAKAG